MCRNRKGCEYVVTGENLSLCKKEFGENLVSLRKAKGMNQKEFAQALGISPTRLNYWEKGKSLPDLIWAKRMADVLGVSISRLMGWNETGIKQYLGFLEYLSSIGYSVNQEVVKWHWEGTTAEDRVQIPDEIVVEVCSLADGKKYRFTADSFDHFQNNIEQAVQFALYQSEK
jgi:transcriptional regulator with XRE-family HTH domain